MNTIPTPETIGRGAAILKQIEFLASELAKLFAGNRTAHPRARRMRTKIQSPNSVLSRADCGATDSAAAGNPGSAEGLDTSAPHITEGKR